MVKWGTFGNCEEIGKNLDNRKMALWVKFLGMSKKIFFFAQSDELDVKSCFLL